MNLKRAIWISVLLYISSFMIGIAIWVATGTDFTTTESISTTHWIISIILSIVLAALFSLWYFQCKKVKPSAKEGLKLGLTFLIVGAILDILLIIPYFSIGGASEVLAYYSEIWFYISVVLIVLTPVVIGALNNKKI